MASDPHIKAIVKLMEACRYRHDLYTVFSDCMSCMALAISNAVDFAQSEAREARYLEIVRRYDQDVIDAFPKVLAEVTMALEAGPCDVLGAVFGALELHNTARGQFFTPFEVCRMMAGMQIGDGAEARAIIERQGFVTACEPACGAGGLIIALAEAMQNAGINYQRHLHVTAVDVDARAAHMAYVQFSLLHIPAVVIVGNALTLEEREHWFTPAHVMGGWNTRLAARERREVAASPAIAVPTCEEGGGVAAPAVPSSARREQRPAHPTGQLTLF
ncbi:MULTISPECIES: N-6 DNA methylase [Xanthomonas]|uniref:Restriction endonuclease subunit M n=2 Tax=Xanthomonas hortorum TaxID=56454 RepID=A0A6V7FF17_9XANT|nr:MULTISPECIES: class I SAM-dependent methyltransferase [Xanthomonas]MCE4356140.1 N-6 DNA methylase [Xanthomonas hortorum pv. pelargonii]MCM5526629.1 N-6 DNA methylase [Xanthomonas hortorum pv. pelargonii]MCM5538589.1 N-6 DNA methylase [Xanthomonas hortorum pv. pelargonii]MCM5542828.1 N-6 DNA methylase [Xanthomonas hortorum pv. pelargonii]MCM5547003.1 N-6 DNA methylase [Xanthomonas hortorum pv. pelargonii]